MRDAWVQTTYTYSSGIDTSRFGRKGYHRTGSDGQWKDCGVHSSYLADFMGESPGFLRVDSSSNQVSLFSSSSVRKLMSQRIGVPNISAGHQPGCAFRCASCHDRRRNGYDVSIRRVIEATPCYRCHTRSSHGSSGEHEGILVEGPQVSCKSTRACNRKANT